MFACEQICVHVQAGVWIQEHFVFPVLTFQKHSSLVRPPRPRGHLSCGCRVGAVWVRLQLPAQGQTALLALSLSHKDVADGAGSTAETQTATHNTANSPGKGSAMNHNTPWPATADTPRRTSNVKQSTARVLRGQSPARQIAPPGSSAGMITDRNVNRLCSCIYGHSHRYTPADPGATHA